MFRILPITILIMVAFLAYKLVSTEEITSEVNVTSHGEIALQDFEPASGDASEDAAKGSEDEGGEAEKDSAEASEENENPLPDYVSLTAPVEKLLLVSDAEKELLERLKQRRIELDLWEDELDLKAGLIEASSNKLDIKIEELEKLKGQTQELITQYQTEEDKKIGSLVKIYESMKPKDAAKVFDQMDIDIMLLIIDEMSERRAAPILAKMNIKRAKQVTEKLANQRSLASERGIASAR